MMAAQEAPQPRHYRLRNAEGEFRPARRLRARQRRRRRNRARSSSDHGSLHARIGDEGL